MDYGLGKTDANVMNPQTLKIPKTGTLKIASVSLGQVDTNGMTPLTNKIQMAHTLSETCASPNVIPTFLNCVAPCFICTAAPLLDISGKISAIIGASWQLIIVQRGKKVEMMSSPTTLMCFALVLACFNHVNALCSKKKGALAYEKLVRSFIQCILLLTLAFSSQKMPCPKSTLS